MKCSTDCWSTSVLLMSPRHPTVLYIDNDDECCYKHKQPTNLFMSRDDDRRRLCADWRPYINTTVTKNLEAKLTALGTRDLFTIVVVLI